jgi:hypothetical protein
LATINCRRQNLDNPSENLAFFIYDLVAASVESVRVRQSECRIHSVIRLDLEESARIAYIVDAGGSQDGAQRNLRAENFTLRADGK